MAAQVPTSSSNRSLLDLAPEIRTRIYELAFGKGMVTVEADVDIFSSFPDLVSRRDFVRLSLRSGQLLRANKQILLEARPIMLNNTIFSIQKYSTPGILPYAADSPLSSHGLLRHLEIDIAPQDLFKILHDVIRKEPFAKCLQDLKITCTCRAWVTGDAFRGVYWASPLEIRSLLDDWLDAHRHVRRQVFEIWVDDGFTHFYDESIEDEMLQFRLYNDPKVVDDVSTLRILSSELTSL